MSRLAVVVNDSSPQVVVTWVRDDTTASPPEGCSLVREADLVPGWRMDGDESQTVPEIVEARKLRRWLILHGRDPDAVSAAINQMPDEVERKLALNEWEYATSYTRRHPLFAAFVRVTGMSQAEVDAAFREADSYE